MIRHWLPIFAILVARSTAWGAADDSAKRSFESLRPLLLQIKTAAEAGAEKTSYGTGFAVRKDGWLITNFHVIADAVWKPKKNRIFAVVDGEDVPAEILSVDIVNDLALVRIPKSFPRTVDLSGPVPANGETLHSLGLPEDLDWTVVNGVSNGLVEQGPYKLIHMSSPINRGMSGGPTVNTRQQLVGVNVSGQIFSQAISFAVPVEFVRRLVARATERENAPAVAPMKDIEADVLRLESELSTLFLKGLKGRKTAVGWWLPKFPSSIRCWGSEGDVDEDKKYSERSEVCQIEHHLFIDGRRFFGMFRIGMRLLENKTLNSWAWRHLRQGTWTNLQLDQISPFDRESAINFGPVRCVDDNVRTALGPRRLRVCSQRLLPFADLNEAEIVIEVPDGETRVLQMHATLSGFTADSIAVIVKQLLERPFREAKK